MNLGESATHADWTSPVTGSYKLLVEEQWLAIATVYDLRLAGMRHQRRATHWLRRIARRQPELFPHWRTAAP
jgi:hypothetical protein